MDPISREVAILAMGFVGWLLGYVIARERLRPVEENPTSRIILRIYEPVLRFLLAHKFSFAAMPILVIILGAGAWFGLPTILYPAEQFARKLGLEPHSIPGYVALTHRFPDCVRTIGSRSMKGLGSTCRPFIPRRASRKALPFCKLRMPLFVRFPRLKMSWARLAEPSPRSIPRRGHD